MLFLSSYALQEVMEERERDPDEPEVDAERVVLDHFNSDLHLQISKDGYVIEFFMT